MASMGNALSCSSIIQVDNAVNASTNLVNIFLVKLSARYTTLNDLFSEGEYVADANVVVPTSATSEELMSEGLLK